MKKIYMFYLYDEKHELTPEKYPAIDELEVLEGNTFFHVLYAWTPNKNIRKQFKSSRNMTIFREMTHEIPDEEFDKFSDENSDTFLEERCITTKKITDDKIIDKRNIYILSTRRELDYIVYNQISIMRKQLECLTKPNIYLQEGCFEDEYRHSLEFLKLDDTMLSVFPIDDNGIPFIPFDDDVLSVYSHLYHNTYRKDLCEI